MDAIEKVEKYGPDLVLMEIKMPGMSGIEGTRRIKQKGDTTVIALTASGFKKIEGQCEPFTQLLEEVANQYKNKELLAFSKNIVSAVERFDIKQVVHQLNKF